MGIFAIFHFFAYCFRRSFGSHGCAVRPQDDISGMPRDLPRPCNACTRALRSPPCHPELVVTRLCCQHFAERQNARLARRLLLFPKISLRCDFREPCFSAQSNGSCAQAHRFPTLFAVFGTAHCSIQDPSTRSLRSLAQDDRRVIFAALPWIGMTWRAFLTPSIILHSTFYILHLERDPSSLRSSG